MSRLTDWPALSGGAPLPALAGYERGVWGKVHGAPTDFRWIARSDAFARGRNDLAMQLDLGSEDAPASFQAWRSLDDRCLAVSGYPSRSIDAAGRRGFLEKQVLDWRRQPDVPAALAALLLLPRVALLTDAIWWDRGGEELRTQPDSSLPIGDSDREPLVVEERELQAIIDRGCEELRNTVPPQSLARLYEQLLTDRRPSFLAGVRRPLGAEALAALLLPLPREHAERMSLAGWIPTERPSFSSLGSRWDVIVTSAEEGAAAASVSERAKRMAGALLENDPALGSQLAQSPVAPPLAEKAAARPATNRPCRPGTRIELAAPAAGAPQLLVELHDFAAAVDRRWLSTSLLQRHLARWPPGGATAELFASWIGQLVAEGPPWVDSAQWSTKIDLLRSAAIALVPDASTVRLAGMPDARSRVPALLVASSCESHVQWDRLAALGERTLRPLLLQSTSCRAPRSVSDSMRTWLRRWQQETQRHDVNLRALVAEALASAPASLND